MNEKLNYLIIGAGGTGGSIAAYMARAEKKVTLIARGKHGKVIREHGLTIIKPKDRFTVAVSVMEESEYQQQADVIFVCVKGYSLDSVYELIKRASHKDTVVIPILNIYGTGEKMSVQLPGIRILNGCIYIAAAIEDYGIIKLSGNIFRIVYGALDGKTDVEIYQSIARDLEDSGIASILSDNIRRDTFQKFSFVSPMAAVGAYYNATAGTFQKEGEVRDTFKACIKEMNELAVVMGIPFDNDIVSVNLEIMDALEPDCTASMQKDLKKGNKSEIDGLLYEVLRMGEEYGTELPVYKKIAEDMKLRNLEFMLATEQDMEAIMELYHEMIGREGCTWSEDYPNMELLQRDIKNQNEFCIKDSQGKVLAAIVIDEDEEVRKLTIWNPDYKKTGELARLAVKQNYQNHGIAVRLIKETAAVMKKRGYDAIHFLVSKTNPPALASYKKLHLHIAGEINLFGVEWICYEGLIDDEFLR